MLPRRVRCVEDVVAADHENAVVVKLLHFLNRSQSICSLPVEVVDPGLAYIEERSIERVTELEWSGNTLLELRILYSPIRDSVLHL